MCRQIVLRAAFAPGDAGSQVLVDVREHACTAR